MMNASIGDFMTEISRMNRKAARKIAVSMTGFDIADFLADYGEEIETPELWTLSRKDLVALLFARIDSHWSTSDGLACELIEWDFSQLKGGE